MERATFFFVDEATTVMVLNSQYGVLTRTRTYNYCISRQRRVERGMYSIDGRRWEEEFTYVCVRGCGTPG